MSIAKKYHQNNDLSELFQVGILGLIKSVDTFSYEKILILLHMLIVVLQMKY